MRTWSFVALLLGGAVALSSQPAHAVWAERDTVQAQKGQILHNTYGYCVRTRWNVGSDECGPPPAPPPAPAPVVVAPPPSPRLTTAQRTVYFDFNKATLDSEAHQQLDTMAGVLLHAEDVKQASIIGYADRIGTDGYNVELSKKRAKAVQDYLAGKGYLKTVVADVRGLGEENPVKNCDTKARRSEQIACLRPNRRVEVEFEYLEPATNP